MTLEFKAKLVFLRFDEGTFTLKLQAAVRKLVKAAAVEFVKAAAPQVPIQTGFARGTFLNVLKAAGSAQANLPGFSLLAAAEKSLVKNLNRPTVRFRPKRKRKFQILNKGFTSSPNFATDPGDIISIDGTGAKFTFATTIDYFRINDAFVNARTPSSPWRSFDAGRAAFLDYLRTNALTEIPNPGKFITTSRIRNNKRGSISREEISG